MNLPVETDRLYKSIYGKGFADVKILENGSEPHKRSKYASLIVKKNKYFGGALNIIFSEFKNQPEYDSLIIMNNDLIVHENFVESMQQAFYKNNLDLLSPCVFNAGDEQPYWRVSHNWGHTKIRIVKWIDFQTPMFSRRLVEEIDQYDQQLMYGWGQDVYTGMICEKRKWKVGVADWISVCHLNQLTQKKFQETGALPVHLFNEKANKGMRDYFKSIGKDMKLEEMRKYARNYTA